MLTSANCFSFGEHKERIPEALHQLEGSGQGKRQSLKEQVNPFKIEAPE
jgi:hypothetical protein